MSDIESACHVELAQFGKSTLPDNHKAVCFTAGMLVMSPGYQLL
jgi:hypothetical protein